MLMVLSLSPSLFGQTPRWNVRGEAIVTCPCRVPCPCRSNARPSQLHCENLSYVRIVEGGYGGVRLNGLQYVWAADECGSPGRDPKRTTLYFSKSATPQQVEAIEGIMTGETCSGMKAAGMRASRLELKAGAIGSLYSVLVDGKARMDVDVRPGPLLMEPLPALDLWGNTVAYARNITARIDDTQAGLKWDYSGSQANYRTFESGSDFIAKGLLLGMFRDDIGRFNETQRTLIRELHLEIPLSREEFRRMLDQVHFPPNEVPAEPRFDEHGSIGGSVFDADGKPRAGARVRISPSAGGYPQSAVTNPGGRYFLAHVPSGKYQLCATTWDGKTSMRGCMEASVRSGQVLNQDLRLTALQAKTMH